MVQPQSFADWQPQYAAAGIATFPVRDKRPAVKGYLHIGLSASEQLATKFADADAFGFACKLNKITVLDVDAPDERLLSEALAEFGPTPIIVRSGSGNFQAWYKHGGERRRVRPDPRRPIDILGNGFVVAPPSRTKNGSYELINGSLADIPALPRMRTVESASRALMASSAATANDHEKIGVGARNDALWRACMMKARTCQTINDLMGAAIQMNNSAFYQPLEDSEVLKIVASAWAKQISGSNWFGRGERITFAHAEVDDLLQQWPDAFILLTILRRHHWGRAFVVANAMAATMPGGGWRRERFAAARKRLEEIGEIEVVTAASRFSGPTTYRFKGAQK
jgi:hypothetical protein